jgi:hypothetical protein
MSAPRWFGDDVFLYRSVRDPADENATCWLLAFYRAVYFFGWTIPEGQQVQAWAERLQWAPGGRPQVV